MATAKKQIAKVETPAKAGKTTAAPKQSTAAKPVEAAKPAAKTASKVTPPVVAKAKKPATKPAAKAKKQPVQIISEAELLKLPEKDYMNAVQMEFFRNRLQSMKAEILDNARETGEHLKENEVFADPNDRATVEEENMLEQRVRDRERKLLKKIDQALARIGEGDYGYCLETGEPIGIPRLLARPTAELCIEAQEKHERMEKLFAD